MQEAIDGCQQLVKETGDTGKAVEDLVEDVETLSRTAQAECDEAHTHIDELSQALEESEDHLQDAVDGAATSLDHLVDQSLAVQGRVKGLLARVQEGMTELTAQKTRLSGELGQKADVADKDFEALSSQIQQLMQDTEKHLQEAGTALDAFQQTVTDAQSSIDQAKVRLAQAFDEVERRALEQADLYVSAVDASLSAQADALVEIANRMLTAHNEAVTAVRKKLAEQARDQIADALEPVKTRIETITASCSDYDAALAQKAADVHAKFTDLADLVLQLRPPLEQRP